MLKLKPEPFYNIAKFTGFIFIATFWDENSFHGEKPSQKWWEVGCNYTVYDDW